ncbi:putative phosphatase of HAD fold family [Sulfitobacter noctilucae]|uniref:phosphatase domain-containing protein n=1 Tax=Sulfitobacter noctilucae TaxID=1342302 RepID=UPI00046A5446|nr:phosphatase domain-containing protein [Sulfitobacter noctilucae]KIN65879.1 putative phosphatase of HAD fold family [Sulfitobacter noctilucae]
MLKKILHTTVWRSEQILDRLRGQRDKRRIIEPYIGYATPDHLVLRGRVLTALRQNKPKPDQSRWTNFKQMFALFLTDEVADVEVTAGGVTAFSDAEGYFTLLLPREDQTGWQEIGLRIVGEDATASCPVLVPGADAAVAVVSDIDDTVLETGAYSLMRNLWTSLTGNALTRHIFSDAQRFLADMSEGGRNPVYFVSSSPWNLHTFLTQIFDRANVVTGPKFLRDLGVSETQFITGTHGDHKGSSIDTLLAANPDVPHVLVGDTGQHDAYVYRDAILRHPGRIVAVVLREPGPGPDADSLAAMREISATGTLVLHGPTFDGFAQKLQAALAQT